MKKILFILLSTISIYGQTTTGKETKFINGIRNQASQVMTDPTNLVTQGTDGTQGVVTASTYKDVLKYATASAFPLTGLVGKLYYAIDTDLYYKWDGATYDEFGAGGTETDPLALKIANNLSDLASASTARTNLGLGTLATQNGTFSNKQDVLVSATNIKTINSTSLLGSGNIVVGDMFNANAETVTGIKTFRGNTGTDGAQFPTESASISATGTNWTGTNLNTTGYVHTTGSVVALTTALNAVNNKTYRLVATITGRTSGTINITFGGTSTGVFSVTSTFYPTTINTNVLTITPTTDFDGTVVISLREVVEGTATTLYENSNGTKVMEINTQRDISLGGGGGGNTNIGLGAGKKVITNTATTTGTQNTNIGTNAGRDLTTGSLNTNVGNNAGLLSINSFENTNIGTSAGQNNLLGSNTNIGSRAGSTGTGFTNSVNIGNFSGFQSNSSNSVNIGVNSAFNLNGAENVNLGFNSGRFLSNGTTANTTGQRSVVIGSQSKVLSDGQTNQIVIGWDAIGAGSNSSTIGNTAVTKAVVNGKLFLPTTPTDVTATTEKMVIRDITTGELKTADLPSGGSGSTNLSTTYAPTTVTIVSSSGTDAIINAVDGTNAGVVTPTQKSTWDGKQDALGFTPYNATNPSGYQTLGEVLSRIDDAIQDTPYDATGWNGVTDDAPSMNSVRDKFVLVDSAISSKYDASNPSGYQTASQVTTAISSRISNEPYSSSWNDITSETASLDILYEQFEIVQDQLNNKQPLSSVLTATTASFTTADETKLDKYPSTATNGKILQGNGTNYVEVDAPTSPTTIVGITGTKAQYDTSVTDGNFMYVGDAPTAHTHTSSDITDFNSATRAQVEAELVAGSNITITPSGTGATRQLTIASTGGGATNLDGLSDVTITTPSTNEVLKYNGTEWVNGSPSNTVKATYTDAIVVTATTAPTGATNHSYCYEDAGGFVDFKLNIDFATAGSSVTSIACELPFGAPVPSLPAGVGAVGDVITYGTGTMTANRALAGAMGVCALRLKSVSPNVFEVVVTRTAASFSKAYYSISYAK